MSRGLGKVEQKIMEFLAMGVMRVDINGLIGKNTKTAKLFAGKSCLPA